MAKKTSSDVHDPYTQAIAQATNDSELLDSLLDYLEVLQGSLDLILEHLEPDEKTIGEIGVTPDKALDNLLDDLNSKAIQIRAKRALSAGIAPPELNERIH